MPEDPRPSASKEDRPTIDAPPLGSASLHSAAVIESIGPYRIIERLGEGGMGVVYKAEQRAPIRRMVAVKVIKLGFDSAEVLARFESERQALARMDHPNIARVLDAGTDDHGRPYFVMEYVPGSPITRYADENRLSIQRRLELMLQVCDAVGHAHAKAIIHRDIKAGNVMAYTTPDGPRIKVIDFGVAKALTSDRLTDRTFNTARGQAIGTYENMSPEQADGSPDIDTRTDVYSLGVLLYELLSGSKPFDKSNLAKAADEEIRRIIREDEPPRPSTQLSSMGDNASKIASARHIELEALTKQLKSELDWIPLMALRKERERRYATPQQLSEDIQNYLNGKPLIAMPDSPSYRLRKFAKRNRGPIFAAGSVLLVLLIGIAGTTLGLAEAVKQRVVAERATTQANQQRDETQRQKAVEIFRNAVLEQQHGHWLLADQGFQRAENAGYPDRQAIISGELRALDRMNRTDDANKLIDRARATIPDVARSPQFMLTEGLFLWTASPKESHDLIHAALAHRDQLDRADRAYAEALMGDDIQEVSANFRETVTNDPYNRDAWIMLSISDLVIGYPQKCEQDLILMQELYPADDIGLSIMALAAALQNHRGDASGYLDRVSGISSVTRQQGQNLIEMICNYATSGYEKGNNEPREATEIFLDIHKFSDRIANLRKTPVPLALIRPLTSFDSISIVDIFKNMGHMDSLIGRLVDLPNGTGEYFLGVGSFPPPETPEASMDFKTSITHLERSLSEPHLIDFRRKAAIALFVAHVGDGQNRELRENEFQPIIEKDLNQIDSLGGIHPERSSEEVVVIDIAITRHFFPQARKMSLKWLANAPDDPNAFYHYATAELGLGQCDIALVMFKHAIEKNLAGEDKLNAEKQIHNLTAMAATRPATMP